MGSYNYLGFAQSNSPTESDVLKSLDDYGLAIAGTRFEYGLSQPQEELERVFAEFMGMEACLIFPMGFATNSQVIPCLVDENCLIVSDKLNHASIILGCRRSNAHRKFFAHQDFEELEEILNSAIVDGKPNGGSWSKSNEK